MSVKDIKVFFLFNAILLLTSSSTASELPSLISTFNKPENKGSTSYLSEGFKKLRRHSHKEENHPADNIKIASSFAPTGSVQQDFQQSERKLNMAEDYQVFDLNFESTQIKDVLAFIEFKMNEITSLIQECIDQEFDKNPGISGKEVRRNCIGSNYQILFYNYNEGIRKVRGVLLELLKLKLENLKEDYEDETNFFMDVLESLVSKDFSIPESLQLAKKASKYYVSPRYFDRLIELTGPEITAFNDLHNRLKTQRNNIQKHIEEKVSEENLYVKEIEVRARKLKQKSEAREMRNRSIRKMRKLNTKIHRSQNNSVIPLQKTFQPNMNMISTLSQQIPEDPFLQSVQGQANNLDLYHSVAMPKEQPNPSPLNLNIELPQQQEDFSSDFKNTKI